MARFILPVAVLAVAAAALFMTPSESTLLGLDHRRFASAAIAASLLHWLILTRLRSARPSDIARIATAALTWSALMVGLVDAYAYRFEASEVAQRIAGEFFPSEPQVGRGGEVIINRRLSGEFAIAGRVNGARVTFLFDTGASAVVLTAADAKRAGSRPEIFPSTFPSRPPTARRWRRRRGSTRSRSGRLSCAMWPRWSRAPTRWTRVCLA